MAESKCLIFWVNLFFGFLPFFFGIFLKIRQTLVFPLEPWIFLFRFFLLGSLIHVIHKIVKNVWVFGDLSVKAEKGPKKIQVSGVV